MIRLTLIIIAFLVSSCISCRFPEESYVYGTSKGETYKSYDFYTTYYALSLVKHDDNDTLRAVFFTHDFASRMMMPFNEALSCTILFTNGMQLSMSGDAYFVDHSAGTEGFSAYINPGTFGKGYAYLIIINDAFSAETKEFFIMPDMSVAINIIANKKL